MTLSEAKRYHAYARKQLSKKREPVSPVTADWRAQPRDLLDWNCFESPRRLRNRRAEGGRDDHGSVVGGNCLSPFTQIVRPRLENLGGVSPTRAEPRIGVKTTAELIEGIT
jgi:hypothetical protein